MAAKDSRDSRESKNQRRNYMVRVVETFGTEVSIEQDLSEGELGATGFFFSTIFNSFFSQFGF